MCFGLPLLVALAACTQGGEECGDPIAWDEEGAVLDLALRLEAEDAHFLNPDLGMTCEVKEYLFPDTDILGYAAVGECTRIFTRPTPPGQSALKVRADADDGNGSHDLRCGDDWNAPLEPGLTTLHLKLGCGEGWYD